MAKILVVDDEPDIQKSVKSLLESRDHDVAIAIDGDDCLKKVKFEQPDLILLDIMMPGTSVQEIIQRITTTKIVFLSAKQTTEKELSDFMSHKNIIDFIKKPFNVEDLIARVEIALQK
jgi:DNA-binding response OmpR family regulator